MIASHYAAPVKRELAEAATLREAPSGESAEVASLAEGDSFEMLDDTLGWAWGYAGGERLVGYVPSDVLKSG